MDKVEFITNMVLTLTEKNCSVPTTSEFNEILAIANKVYGE